MIVQLLRLNSKLSNEGLLSISTDVVGAIAYGVAAGKVKPMWEGGKDSFSGELSEYKAGLDSIVPGRVDEYLMRLCRSGLDSEGYPRSLAPGVLLHVVAFPLGFDFQDVVPFIDEVSGHRATGLPIDKRFTDMFEPALIDAFATSFCPHGGSGGICFYIGEHKEEDPQRDCVYAAIISKPSTVATNYRIFDDLFGKPVEPLGAPSTVTLH